MIKISATHPSKGRPRKAVQSMMNWLAAADHPEEIEYLFALDESDPHYQEYLQIIPRQTIFAQVAIHAQPSRNIVQAGNMIVRKISDTAEIIASVHDDLDPCPHWDTELTNLLAGVDNFNTPRLIRASDGVQSFDKSMIMFFNRAWVKRGACLIYPGYTGCFCDNEVLDTARILAALIEAPQLVFMHRHYSAGLAEYDTTYDSHNNNADYFRNKELYLERKARNFDL